MATNVKATVIKYPKRFSHSMQNLTPSGFNEPDQIEEVPVDFGTPVIPPEDRHKTDLWQQYLLQLKDIPFSLWWQNPGKSLVVRRSGEPSPEGWVVELAYPDRLETAREFSISGDGVAVPVEFDGTGNVELELTDVAATSLKTPRSFVMEGAVTSDVALFDATGNVVFQTYYSGVVPDINLPDWISENDQTFANFITNYAAIKTTVQHSGVSTLVLTKSHVDKYTVVIPGGSITIPPGVFAANDIIYIRIASGPGTCTLVPGVGVTLYPPHGRNLVISGERATIGLVCVNNNQFDVIGDTQYV